MLWVRVRLRVMIKVAIERNRMCLRCVGKAKANSHVEIHLREIRGLGF